MISQELLKKVRKLEIQTKGLVNSFFGGEYHSAFKGRGMEFSEVRAYSYGDDIRQIDWNVTARSDEPYVKVFEEEREQILMLCVDISPSGFFGSRSQTKMELAAEISAVLAFSAIKNGDKVGLLLFSDRIEKVIPPKKGRTHVLRLIRELLTAKPEGRGTDLGGALAYVNRLLNRRAIVILVSDFQDREFEKQLKITHRKHDLVNIVIQDEHENDLPDLGLIPLLDPETGNRILVDSSSRKARVAFRERRMKRMAAMEELFRRYTIDGVFVQTNRSWVRSLMSFFRRRLHRQ